MHAVLALPALRARPDLSARSARDADGQRPLGGWRLAGGAPVLSLGRFGPTDGALLREATVNHTPIVHMTAPRGAGRCARPAGR
jgi:hypothetical protein